MIAIFATDLAHGFGFRGRLPWPKNSEDLKWFKNKTEHSSVLMGRKTWESLPFKLPNRDNLVVTSGKAPAGADVVGDLKSMLKILPQIQLHSDIWVIGGAQLVEFMLHYIDELWLNKEKITELYNVSFTEEKSFGTITRGIKKT